MEMGRVGKPKVHLVSPPHLFIVPIAPYTLHGSIYSDDKPYESMIQILLHFVFQFMSHVNDRIFVVVAV